MIPHARLHARPYTRQCVSSHPTEYIVSGKRASGGSGRPHPTQPPQFLPNPLLLSGIVGPVLLVAPQQDAALAAGDPGG